MREERKAVIAISQGWRLYGEDPALRRPSTATSQPVPPMGMDPRTGRLGTSSSGAGTDSYADRRKCEQERLSLSMLRNDLRFIDILRQANTGNTSFYPVDPRGLVVFDEDIVPISPSGRWKPKVGVVEDSQRLRRAQRLAAHDGGRDRWPRRRAGRRSLRRHAAHRRGSQLVLSARLLLHAATSTENSTASPCA